MILFLDESYKADSAGEWHYALAGFGINEFRYRALQAAVYKVRRQYFDLKSNYAGDSWREALNDKIIVERPVEDIELKAELLLKFGTLRRFGGLNAPHYRLVVDVLRMVENCRGTCVGVLLNPKHPDEIKDCSNGCPVAYQRIIQVVGKWMAEEYGGQSIVLALDTEHSGVNLPLSRAIADYLYKTRTGQNLKHIVPSPFWIDSKSMVGAQVADLIAHILMNSMMPESERKPLHGLWRQIYDLRFQWMSGSGGTIIRPRRT